MNAHSVTHESATVWHSRAQTAAYFGGHIVLGIVSASLGPTIASLGARVGQTAGALGFLFSARAIGYLLGSLVSGKAYDKTAGHPILSAMVASLVALLLLVPMAPTALALAGIFLLIGAAQGTMDVGNNTLLAWVHGPKIPPYLSALHCFFGFGAVFAPMIVTLGRDLSRSYFLLAMAIAPATLLFSLTKSPPRMSAAKETGNAVEKPWLVLLLGVSFFLYQGAEVGFGGWIFSYANALGLSDKSASTLTSVFWSAFTLGRILTVPLSARAKSVEVLAFACAGAIFGLFSILAFPSSFTVLFASTALIGFALAPVFPMAISLAAKEMRLSGAITSRLLVGASMGSMVLPWLIGRAFSLGPRGPMLAILASTIALGIVFWVVSKNLHKTRGSI